MIILSFQGNSVTKEKKKGFMGRLNSGLKPGRTTQVITVVFFFIFATGCLPNIRANDPLSPASLENKTGEILYDEYRIQPGDILDIKFFYNKEFNEDGLPVRPDGRISLQLAHEIMAAGLTPEELTKSLAKKYASVLKNPEITVILRSFAHRIYVDGEVESPGELEVAGPVTALQAIARAGGAKQSAQIDQVIVLRRSITGNAQVFELNLEDALTGEDLSQDLALLPQDIVYVPLLGIANVNKWVDLYLRKNIPFNAGVFFRLND